MKGNFVQLKKFLESRFPELNRHNIHGMVHPPTPTAELVGQVIGAIWFVGIALLFGGNYIFSMIGIPEPSWYQTVKGNPVGVFVGLFLLNNVGGALMQTGAFEVYLNNELVYSKLQTGRMPNGDDIIRALSTHGLQ